MLERPPWDWSPGLRISRTLSPPRELAEPAAADDGGGGGGGGGGGVTGPDWMGG